MENRKQKPVCVPPMILERGGLSDAEFLGMFALKNSVVVLKDTMNAEEVLAAFESMTYMARELLLVLILACGRCEERPSSCRSGAGDQDGLDPVWNIAPETRGILRGCGVCIGALNELLQTGETIYGGP